ncbi:hypothetical protein AVEN_162040-1 [Araneus ventricosus]|uniref:Uncharacterized protein n=1 Tax=Araneus ventricosus TaxID=182803 RepID=A0A4Y2NWK4_ARAVE|nr:hypothetical protein AVEN_162040-1 [Araneus ventricosus]
MAPPQHLTRSTGSRLPEIMLQNQSQLPTRGAAHAFNYSVNEVDMKLLRSREAFLQRGVKARLLITAASRRNATRELRKSPVNAISKMTDGFDSNTNCFVSRDRFVTNDPPNTHWLGTESFSRALPYSPFPLFAMSELLLGKLCLKHWDRRMAEKEVRKCDFASKLQGQKFLNFGVLENCHICHFMRTHMCYNC